MLGLNEASEKGYTECLLLGHWVSTFVPNAETPNTDHVIVTFNLKIISLLLRNYIFATVMNCDVNV